GLCALGATLKLPIEEPIHTPGRLAIGIALALVILPISAFITWRAPQPVTGSGWPLRVMSYNLHQGFDTDGILGMEALAQTIEREQPDVVAFQEISRGWYINGSLDMLPWLSQRLGMPYIFGPAADPAWGNAILSRYPIADYGSGILPQDYGPMERGYLWAKIDAGNGQELLVIATHLHSVEVDHDIHIHQVSTVLDFWAGRPAAVILGDLNSWPNSPEMGLFREAGLLDAFAELGTGEGYTWPAYDLFERIDYIWYTPDFHASDFAITTGTASDHLGIAVTLGRH
ncbi:MAG: endonuclease/exonuclease/phosphatase family protein, partial [Chloroflexi bacterium]|nr:endonuclease/exonuclease/phosphatase family protein [Chloroflexota bacterium]